jgi:hypothetical protein
MEDGFEQMASTIMHNYLEKNNTYKNLLYIYMSNNKMNYLITDNKDVAIMFSKKNNCTIEIYEKLLDGSYKYINLLE